MIRQGDIYWFDPGVPVGSAPGFLRPYVVVSNDIYNDSGIRTVVVCSVTTNLVRSKDPANVPLEKDEGGLKRPSVVNVSQLLSVDKDVLIQKMGRLSHRRIREVVEGIFEVLQPIHADDVPE